MAKSTHKIWLEQDTSMLLTVTIGFALVLWLLVKIVRQTSSMDLKGLPLPSQTLDLIKTRRSVTPKDYDLAADSPVSEEELQSLLEAANWAPTHGKTEPWRFVIMSGPEAINNYFNFLEDWYDQRNDQLSEEALAKFRTKLNGVRQAWPDRVSHLVLIVMKRQALPDKLMPEWEELCAVAMAVQNLHLMATAFKDIGVFWSSHTWCKDCRDSKELKMHFNFAQEDKILGCLTVGKVVDSSKFTSTRSPISNKLQHRR